MKKKIGSEENEKPLESKTNFDLAYTFTKKWEGGYVNNAADPGGETKYGISKRAYPNLDIVALTEEDAKAIYLRDYWNVMHDSDRPIAYACAVFDTAVNCGIARATLWLAESNNVEEFLKYRVNHYESIVEKNPKLQKFMKGWMRRVDALHKYIASLSENLEVKSG